MIGNQSGHSGLCVGTRVASFDDIVYNEILKRRRTTSNSQQATATGMTFSKEVIAERTIHNLAHRLQDDNGDKVYFMLIEFFKKLESSITIKSLLAEDPANIETLKDVLLSIMVTAENVNNK